MHGKTIEACPPKGKAVATLGAITHSNAVATMPRLHFILVILPRRVYQIENIFYALIIFAIFYFLFTIALCSGSAPTRTLMRSSPRYF